MVPNKVIYVFATLLVLIGGLLMTSLMSEFIPSYNYGKTFSKNANCTVVSNAINGTVCCEASVTVITECNEDFVYPCLQVRLTT